MSLTNNSTLKADLKPFLKFARIFGFVPYSVSENDVSLSRFGIIYSGFCSIIYTYVLCIRLELINSPDGDPKLRFLTIIRTLLSGSVIFVDIFVSIIWHRKLQASLACIQRYDHAVKLEATSRKNSIRCWIGLFATAIYFIVLGCLTYYYEIVRRFENSMVYIVLYASMSFSILKFSAIVGSLLRRFRHLNRMIKAGLWKDQLTIGHTALGIFTAGWSQRQLNLRDAWCLHGCLVAAAEQLNSLYSVQLLLWIAGLTFNVISRIYVLFETDGIVNFSKVFREGGLAAAFVLLLAALAAVCHMTAAEEGRSYKKESEKSKMVMVTDSANKVGTIAFSPDSGIYRRRRDFSNSEFEEGIQIGLYFLFHRFNFSAASGLIQVDLPLLQTIAGTMTTYLVILKAPG